MRTSILLASLLFLIFFQPTYSQVVVNPTVFSGNSVDEILDAVTDEKGNMYVLGVIYTDYYYKPAYIITPDSKKELSATNFFVAIYNKEGALLKLSGVSWAGSYLKSIAVDKAGFIYLTGSESQYSLTVAKLDQNLNKVWLNSEGSSSTFIGHKVIVDENGNVYVAGKVRGWSVFGLRLQEKSCCRDRDFLIKFDSNGNFKWIKAGLGEDLESNAYSITFDKKGNIILVGSMMWYGHYGSTTLSTQIGLERLLAVKYTPQGEIIWAKLFGGYNNYSEGYDVVTDESDNIYIAGTYARSATFDTINLPAPTTGPDALLLKLTSSGNAIWAKATSHSIGMDQYSSLEYKLGKLTVGGLAKGTFYSSDGQALIASYDHAGNFRWATDIYGSLIAPVKKVLTTTDGKVHAFGTFVGDLIVGKNTFTAVGVAPSRKQDGYYVQVLDTLTTPYINSITGKIYSENTIDVNNGIGGIVVIANPGPFYGITNSGGNYKISVDSGNYVVTPIIKQLPGRSIIPTSPSSGKIENIHVIDPGETVKNINFGNKVTLSPYLTTSVSSTRRRRCFESTTKVTYSNSGFAAAENAKVYLQLPKEVELLSADKTFTSLPNGTYVFDVGTLAAGQIGTITIQDKVVCGDESIRGLTVCTKAWISTAVESKCPVVTTTAKCNTATGEVRVVIKNTGPEDMQVGELFRIYRNGQLTTVESYKLAAGDSLVLWIPAGGKTVRLEAEQPGCNVSNTLASVTIEGCKVTTDPAPVSTGFVNALPPDEEEPEAAEECLLITDSYDPNDKQVTPTGLTQENYTPTNTALTYKVRFQNTGTDVAYRVVVTDTLSEHLDISTLQMGTASHTYRYEVGGKGRPVLTWTFDNIMLPDSTTNEPGSHGYIQFSIKPKADLPEKTAVENFADIFFDFNAPVRTNTTINRIYDMPEEIAETDRLVATTLIATPVLEGFSPASGKLGAEVILTGKKFSTVAANNKVMFNGVQATVLAASENELKVQVPANATSGNIKVQTLDGAANSATSFEVYQPPVVSGFMPAEGIAGTTVTLQGNHLTEAWLQSIKLGDLACEIISISGTGVVVKVPAGANSDTFQVLSKGGQAQSTSRFIVWHQPAISNLSTVLDKVGATVLITGSNFAPEANRNIVWFGAAKAQVLQATTTTLKVKVPAGATSGIITLETPGGTAQSPAIFEVIPAPQVFTFKPAAGSVGSEVELTGAHFLTFGKQDTIMFNGQKAVVLEAAPDQFKVRVPRGATSGKITVAGVGGQAITASEFKVEELSPEQAIEVYPNPTNGNFTIRFAHADFEIQDIQLFSTLGTLVYSERVSSPRPEQLDVKLTSPKTGIYILHIKTERGLVIKKLHIL